MVRIIDIEPESIAQELGISIGDELISINGKPINDRLDYRFYISEENVELLINKEGREILYEIEKDADDQLGLLPEEMKLNSCGNNCLFCFVSQNPKGLRRALYFRDEDYRFSFLYGHYVTMTRLKHKDLERIVEQRLSPLYISIHSTEEETRKYLLGIRRDDHLLEKIEYLTTNGIELHTQIVLCPGINDGPILEKTVKDLSKFYPVLKSIAVVPLGLTKYRENLPKLRLHRLPELIQTIEQVNLMRLVYRKKLGNNFVYLSDEFFIKTQREIPPADYYDDFYQIENGVGEFRTMIDRFNAEWPKQPKHLSRPVRITWVSGMLAAQPLEKYIIKKLRTIKNLEIDLIPVLNNFFGPSIQVSGLLVGQDIFNQLTGRELGDLVLLPPRVLNDDFLLLDNWKVTEIENKLGVRCHVYTEDISRFTEVIESFK